MSEKKTRGEKKYAASDKRETSAFPFQSFAAAVGPKSLLIKIRWRGGHDFAGRVEEDQESSPVPKSFRGERKLFNLKLHFETLFRNLGTVQHLASAAATAVACMQLFLATSDCLSRLATATSV